MMEKEYYRSLREKIVKWGGPASDRQKWRDYILIAPDFFHLLWKLSADPEVPRKQKMYLLAVLSYFISPIDLIPEAVLGPLAFTDDIALGAFVVNQLLNHIDPQLLKKYWLGDGDVLHAIKKVLAVAEKMVGSKIWRKLRRFP